MVYMNETNLHIVIESTVSKITRDDWAASVSTDGLVVKILFNYFNNNKIIIAAPIPMYSNLLLFLYSYF